MKIRKLECVAFLSILVLLSSCFGTGRSSKRGNLLSNQDSGSAASGVCEENETPMIFNGETVCVPQGALEDAECQSITDCDVGQYCDINQTPYVCSEQPCMTDSDCPQSNQTWGPMTCDKTSIPYRCVAGQGDQCVRTGTAPNYTHNCGNLSYCDVTHGHPYTCQPHVCSGDTVCQKCDPGMSCAWVGNFRINTRTDGSTYRYECNLSLYAHACVKVELTGPTGSTGCTTNSDCNWGGTQNAYCNTSVNPHVCECNNSNQCPSNQFCRVSTKKCQDQIPNECVVSGNGDNCDDLYFGMSQYFCDFNTPYTCRIKITGTGPGSHCTKHYQCFSEWCYYAGNNDPTAEPPYPQTGYCRNKAGDGTFNGVLDNAENCISASHCKSGACTNDITNNTNTGSAVPVISMNKTCGRSAGYVGGACTNANCLVTLPNNGGTISECKSGTIAGYSSVTFYGGVTIYYPSGTAQHTCLQNSLNSKCTNMLKISTSNYMMCNSSTMKCSRPTDIYDETVWGNCVPK